MKILIIQLSCLGLTFSSSAQHSSLSLENFPAKNSVKEIKYIPAKTFLSLSHTGSDSASFYKPRYSSVAGFYMSSTEVTNKEYREFTSYVRDSIAHTLLQHSKNGHIDWGKKIDWNDERLESIMVKADDRIYGRKEIDPLKLQFEINFFGNKELIAVVPDTLVWMRDFAYSYNEPLVKRYYAHPSFDNYPVVGISLKQAIAFCQWKTSTINAELKQKNAGYEVAVRLPSDAEWESAAFDGKDNISTTKPYAYNFGPIINTKGDTTKRYDGDGYFYTSPVKKFHPNVFGLYDMKGNVSEWTSSTEDEIRTTGFQATAHEGPFVVKGGGWNSTAFYLQAGVCQFLPADAANSFTGFRYVVFASKRK